MKKYLERLKNPATIIGISGYILTILTALGVVIDNDTVLTIIQSVCAICVLLGILNNPEAFKFTRTMEQNLLRAWLSCI